MGKMALRVCCVPTVLRSYKKLCTGRIHVSPMYIRKTKFLKDDLGDYDDANHFEYE